MREELKINNSMEGIEFLKVSLERIALSWNMSDKLLLELNLILEELCSNYLAHAGGTPQNFIEIQLLLDGLLLEITVKDSGQPFNPTEIHDPDINLSIDEREPGGLGLFFVKHYSDTIKYVRENGKNIVTITKSF